MHPTRLVLALAAVLALGACESSSEKAERYYQSAMSLLDAGDLDRAVVELRNVFRFDGSHYAARQQLADLLIQRGDVRDGYSQLLRLAEQYPQNAEIRRQLALLAIDLGNWEEVERHGREAAALEADHPEQATINLVLDYRAAVLQRNDEQVRQVIERTEEAAAAAPDNAVLLKLLVSYYIEQNRDAEAMRVTDTLIAAEPDSLDSAMLKLGLLSRGSDDAATEAYLTQLTERFSGEIKVLATQAAWYVSKGNIDEAEQVWRRIATEAGDSTDEKVALIQFLERYRSPQAALAEADRLSAEAGTNIAARQLFDSFRAFYMFNLDRRHEAVALLRGTLEGAEASDQTNRIKATLAGMLLKMGQKEEADRLVEEVLTADASNVLALHVRAESLLNADRANEAVLELRRALDQEPRNLETLNLLATAYERTGNRQLMGETLASAVDISSAAPQQSLRYAAFLVQDNRRAPARTVIEDALRANPSQPDLLMAAAQMALEEQSYSRVDQIATQLEAMENNPAAQSAAGALRSEIMLRQGRVDEGLSLMQQRAEAGQGNRAAVLALIRARVMAGQTDEARSYLDELLAESPADQELQIINAGLLMAEGNLDEAERVLRAVIAAEPQNPGPVQLLYGQLSAQGRAEEATAVLTEALSNIPDDQRLNMMQASVLEREGRVDEAIAIYERLYAANPADTVLANNVASLLATWRRDPESLARATAAAQRLRGTSVPAFQDTYGWIAYLNNNAEEALPYLEQAARGIPQDPLVRFHLGMTQARLGHTDAARESLNSALQLAGDRDLPQMAEAREALVSLDSPAAADTDADADAAQEPAGEAGQ